MRNDQSTRVNSAAVIIVGGGVIGLAIARALTERGVSRVVVMDQSTPGREASYAAGGMLSAQTEADQADSFFELSLASRELYPSWAASLFEETGIDIELDRTGTLYLAFSSEDEEEIERRFQWQSEAGFPVERLSGTEARQLEPAISRHVRSALKFRLDVQVENRRLIDALLSSLTRRGVQVQPETHVTALSFENGRVTGVKTKSNTIHAPIIVVASGAWTSLLTYSDSLVPPVRIEPVHGQMLCMTPTVGIRHVLYSARGYVVPRRGGHVLLGSTTEHIGFDKNVTSDGMHTIMTNALEIAPDALRDAPLVDSWAGLRPRAEDGLPIIGACAEIEGLYFATGHYRNGVLLAPVTGLLIAEQITNGIAPALVSAFSPDRFHALAVS